MERKTKAATESGILLLVIAGILVALNAISAFGGYKRIDTTKAEKYTLSRGSSSLIKSIKKDKMKVDAYVTKGLPKLDAFVRDLRDLLIEYQNNGGGKFEFRIIEPKEDKDKEAAKDAGCVQQPFGEAREEEDKAAITQGYMCLVFNYGTERDAIKFLPPERTDGLEFWITNKIREVRDKGDGVKHKIGVVSGKDEIKLTESNLVPHNMGRPSMQQIITQNFSYYQFQDVDLKGGDADVPDDLDGLIITQPGKDFTEKELRRIDQFVMRGKSLAIFAGAVNVKNADASMNASLNTHGLEKLLDGYGVELKKDAVIDFGRSFRVSVMTQGGVATARFPQFLDVQDDSRYTGDEAFLDTAFPAFFRIPAVVVPFASSIVLHKEKQPDIPADKFKVVVRSTPRSIAETGDTVDLKPFRSWKPKGQWQQYNLGATLEGTVSSAFPSGDKMGIEAPAKSAKPARIFVLASSQFLANPFARAGNGPDMQGMMMPGMDLGGDQQLQQLAGPYAQQALTQTIVAFKNTLDWITGDTDLLAVSAKILTEPGLSYGDTAKPNFNEESEDQLKKRDEEMKKSKERTQLWIRLSLIVFLPLLFAILGVIRWQIRLRARENVSLA
jgi:ABC-type uncharacterized transport system involved in gliding motility auxiliary subunit